MERAAARQQSIKPGTRFCLLFNLQSTIFFLIDNFFEHNVLLLGNLRVTLYICVYIADLVLSLACPHIPHCKYKQNQNTCIKKSYMQGELAASKMITRKDYETSASLSLHGWLAIPYISD